MKFKPLKIIKISSVIIGFIVSITLIYKFYYNFIYNKKELTYNWYASRMVYPNNKNIMDFYIKLRNTGHIPIYGKVRVRIYFRDRDARIWYFKPFVTTFKYKEFKKEKDYPPLIIIESLKFPYLKQIVKRDKGIYIEFLGALPIIPLSAFEQFCNIHSLEDMKEKLVEYTGFSKHLIEQMIREVKSGRTKESSWEKDVVVAAGLTYDMFPSEAFEIYTYIKPIKPKDVEELHLEAIVKDISMFRSRPPILRMELDAPEIKLKEESRSFGAFWDFLHSHMRGFILILILSIILNIYLIIKWRALSKRVEKMAGSALDIGQNE